MKLAEKVKYVTTADLGEIVSIVASLCPSALCHLDSRRLQVIISELNRSTFEALNTMLDTGITDPPSKIAKTH